MDCNFCGISIPKGTEYIHVTSKGKAQYFCSSKCLKCLVKHNRKPRETKWTKSYVDEKASRLKTAGQKAEPPKAPEKPKEKAPEKAAKAEEGKAEAKPAKKAEAKKGRKQGKESKK
jgi:ribosomal protein L24E